MSTLKYKVIGSKVRHKQYSNILEKLIFTKVKTRDIKEEIALLTLLIEKWDAEHNTFNDLDPVQLLQSLMKEHGLKAKDMVEILNIGKSYVSDILNYKKGLSKEVIRKLAEYFKMNQEAFNRPYKLVSPANSKLQIAKTNIRGKKFKVA